MEHTIKVVRKVINLFNIPLAVCKIMLNISEISCMRL